MEPYQKWIANKNWEKKLKKDLSTDRYKHTLRVAKTAYNLALTHQTNIKKAVIAAYLHDCAKNYKDKKLLKYARKYHLRVSETEKNNMELLHAKVGAYVAWDWFGQKDPDIFYAICHHTTGRPAMTNLEKIIYISDYIEPGRRPRGRINEIRKHAFKNLNLATLYILEDTLEYLEKKHKTIDPLTKEAYDYYQRQLHEHRKKDIKV